MIVAAAVLFVVAGMVAAAVLAAWRFGLLASQ